MCFLICAKRKIGCAYNLQTNSLSLIGFCVGYGYFSAVYKSGTGTRGRGLRDACVGTWDLETRDEGLEDIKCGTRGRGDVKHRDAEDTGCE